jgi:hypothetical protein
MVLLPQCYCISALPVALTGGTRERNLMQSVADRKRVAVAALSPVLQPTDDVTKLFFVVADATAIQS